LHERKDGIMEFSEKILNLAAEAEKELAPVFAEMKKTSDTSAPSIAGRMKSSCFSATSHLLKT
jgi:hypothetical protein